MKPIKPTLMPVALLSVALVLSFNPAICSADSAAEQLRSGEIIVEIKPGASIEEVNGRNGTATVERINGTNFYRLLIPLGKSESKWIKRLSRDRDVVSASFNPIVMSPTSVFGRATVGFPGGRPSPGLSRVEYVYQRTLRDLLALREAHLRSRGSGVVVAIIDTGVDRTHTALASRLWRDTRQLGEVESDGIDNDLDGLVDDHAGWDFIDNDNDPSENASDPETSVAGHGTFIAGLVALVAPDCRILPVRAFTPGGVSNAFTVASAIKYAADHGADVINLSFGSPRKSRVVRDAIKYARQRGAVLVAAAGNEGENIDKFPQYPAALSPVMSVAAMDEGSIKAGFSNFGKRVSVTALGVGLASAYPGEDYAVWSGTSFAAPLAAAQAALVLAQDDDNDARAVIESTADPIDDLNTAYSGKMGRGRINLLASLESFYDTPKPSGNYAYIYLDPSAGYSEASARAGVIITGARQELTISAHGLDVRARYRLYVNGIDVAPEGFTASSFGGLRIRLTNEPESVSEYGAVQLKLPTSLYPVTRIQSVELRNEAGKWLKGAFAPAVGSAAPAGETITKQTPLASAGDARGKAYVKLDGANEELRVEVNRLTPGASYDIFVDGVGIGSAVARAETRQSGFLRIIATTDGSSGLSLPPQSRPLLNIKRVEVRDSAGQVVLRGDFLAGGDDFGRTRR
ncbi:MAG TPA: S8 family serine peptidase [Blastocatellia bacterium]|nr:S8 family serine peptidase [Blastocatellia bacterium]